MHAAGIVERSGAVTPLDLAEPRAPAADEIVMSVKAAGVGPWERFVQAGQWDVGRSPPMALGVEAAGVVVAIGSEVDTVAVGDEVLTHPLPLRDQGAWAEQLVAPAALVARKPPSVSFAAASIFPVPALTAEQVLTEALKVKADEALLVHGAGGLTGGMIVQLAVAMGISVTATAGPSSADRVRSYATDRVLDYHDPDWPSQARAGTPEGKGHPVVANAAWGEAAVAMSATADGGRLATITGDPPAPERGITVSNVYVQPDGWQLSVMSALLEEGRLAVPEPDRYGLDEAAIAFAASASGKGSTAITP